MAIKKTNRHTIMDGRVVTFARDFREEEGIIGKQYKPLGPVEVSASRNKVVVHTAELRTINAKTLLEEILNLAWHEHRKLVKCNGRPQDDWKGEPRKAND